MACQQAAQDEWDGMWTAPPILEVLGQMDYLPPVDFKGMRDYWEVWIEETVALAKAVERCTICSGMPPWELCGAIQELCKYLTPMVKRGDQFDLQMLNVAEKEPETPTSPERNLSPTSKLQDAAPVEELPWYPYDKNHCHLLGSPSHGQMSPAHFPLRMLTGLWPCP